jgi:TonB family protein
MYRPIGKFILLSVLVHVLFFQVAGLIVIDPPTPDPAPIKVEVLDPAPPAPSEKMASGRIEETAAPKVEQVPEEAKILSRFDAIAHNPEQGKKYQGSHEAIPREKIDPTPPAKEKAETPTPALDPNPQETLVAALHRPDVVKKDKPVAPQLDLFSEEMIKKAMESSQERRSKKGDPSEEKSPKLSTKITDRPDPSTNRPDSPSGVSSAKGSDIDNYLMASTNDEIDLGDEALVSLNTKSFKYFDYFNSVKRAISLVWSYPEEAIINGLSGRTMLRFTIDKNGQLLDVTIMNSSGKKVLDDEATLAIKAAGPFEPFPVTLDKERLHILATFEYRPNYGAVQ